MIFDEKYFRFEDGVLKVKPYEFTPVMQERSSKFDQYIQKAKYYMKDAYYTCSYTAKNNEEFLWKIGKIGAYSIVGSYGVPLLATACGAGKAGIIGGSLMSKWQVYYQGFIPVGSFFSWIQSAGMTGAFSSYGAVAGVITATVGLFVFLLFCKYRIT